MVSRCEMASGLCVAFTAWFTGFGAMAICMITLDYSVTGTYFWNYPVQNSTTSNSTDVLQDEIKATTITQTQLMCRLVIYVGLSTFLSVILQWSCSIRRAKSAEKIENDCQYNRTKVNALSDHITYGRTEVIVKNMDILLAFIAEVKAGNDRCEALLNQWYRIYTGFPYGYTYYAYSYARRSQEQILLQLLEGYRGPVDTPITERRVTLV